MKIPKGMNEKEVLEIIEKVVNIVYKKFVFGYFQPDDIKQEARIIALKALEEYNGKHPLANFLAVSIKNRLKNFKRDNFQRNEAPCSKCAKAYNNITLHKNQKYCSKHLRWVKRNNTRQNLMYTLNIQNINFEHEDNAIIKDNIANEVYHKEIINKIDEKLPLKYRKYYLQIMDGYQIPKRKKKEVYLAIRSIVNGN